MSEYLPFVVAGLTTGSLYGLLATGLVVTYRTSGLFNFAHGAVGAVGAYVFYTLNNTHGLPWPIAALLCVGVLGPIGGTLLELLSRRLRDVSPAMTVVGTVGLLLLISNVLTLLYGASTLAAPPFLPVGTVSIAGTFVGTDQLTTFVVASLSAIALAVFLRTTPLGLAMRGVVDDARLAGLVGVDAVRVRRTAWMIGSSFAVATGVLIAPVVGLNAYILALLVVQAFGAAAIGRFDSLPLSFVGGLAIGVLAALSTKFIGQAPSLAGIPSSIPFLVLFIALLVTPRRRLPDRVTSRRARRAPLETRASVRLVAVGAAGFVLLALPMLVGTRLPVYTSALILVIVFLSLGMLVWTSGQVSLCHAVFVAIGASTASHLLSAGVPWGLAVTGAAVAAVPAGVLVALPAIRLSGIYLALATLGFGVLAQSLLYSNPIMFGSDGNALVPRPGVFGLDSDRGYFYLVLAITAVVASSVLRLERSRLGRLLRGLADSPLALATHGAQINTIRVAIFCISAFIAGLAGALSGALSVSVSAQGFQPLTSLTWLAVIAIAGARVGVAPAVIGALALAVLPVYLASVRAEYFGMLFGALAMFVAARADGRPSVAVSGAVAERTAERARTSPAAHRPALREPAL